MIPLSITILACFSIACYTVTAAGVDFNYDNQAAWRYLPKSQCGGNRQSPINIVKNDLRTNEKLEPLQMNGWNVPVSGKLENNGKTVEFVPGSKQAVTVTHLGEYTLQQFHLHWGNRVGVGSEHRFNGGQYDGELHFVHTRANPPPSSGSEGEADYTVVAIFLQSSSTAVAHGSVWENFLNIPGFEQHRDVSITYSDLLPSDLSYYYYGGSLTTPLCNQVVQWVVLQNPIPIPMTVLERLRTTPICCTSGAVLTKNFRNVQQLNGRIVYQFDECE